MAVLTLILQNALKSRKALIAFVEMWTPNFWIRVYEALGNKLPFPLILSLVFYIF